MNYLSNFSPYFSTIQRLKVAAIQILSLLWVLLTSETFKVSLVLSAKVMLFALVIAIRAMLLTIEYLDNSLTKFTH